MIFERFFIYCSLNRFLQQLNSSLFSHVLLMLHSTPALLYFSPPVYLSLLICHCPINYISPIYELLLSVIPHQQA